MTLHNFKGVRDNVFQPGGLNVALEGRNGSGKSTFFDAFTWLLFGKDHRSQSWTNFDIKPIDPATGEPFHHLDHWVEAELLIDGSRKTLRRELHENWVKPRGQAEEILQGHTQSFFIDGIPCSTMRDYDTAVAQWVNEEVFKNITNPLQLIDENYTPWKVRREVLLQLAGDVDLTGIRADFADVLAEAAGTPLEDFRKKVAADRKATRKELDTANANVKAWNKALPEPVDLEAIQAEKQQISDAIDAAIDKVKAEISDVDAGVLNAQSAVSKTRSAIAEKAREVQELNVEQTRLVGSAYNAAQALYAEQLAAYDKQQRSIDAAERVIDKANSDIEMANKSIDYYKAVEADKLGELQKLGELYKRRSDAAFEQPDLCPTCGQPLPAELVESERTAWNEIRRRDLDHIKQDGARVKEVITEARKHIEDWAASLEKYNAEKAAAQQRLEALATGATLLEKPAEVVHAAIAAEVRKGKKYADLQARIDALEAECKELQDNTPVDLTELVKKRGALEEEIDRLNKQRAAQLEPIMAKEAVNGERFRLEGMIAAEEDRARELADELARLERLEFRAAELAKAEIDAQTDAVNALFKVARWKMFDYTLDGGAVEMCEVTSPDGVPYRSMNDAMRVQVGMDVIRTVGARYGITAPIFIDNAEGVLQDTFDTPAQVIRLVVRDCDLTEVINNQ